MKSLDFSNPSSPPQVFIAGIYLCRKVREQVEVSGAYQAARNLRKQGAGIDVALALVAGRVS